jgi:MFS superfamily sulfate permease-like transporter
MKLWHVMAATAWAAVFLGLSRAAAGLLAATVLREDAWDSIGLTLASACMVMIAAAPLAWWAVEVPRMRWLNGRAACLAIPVAITVIVGVTIGVFCWVEVG